ncbi:MAG: glycosyl hydrolase family 32 [Actinomycetota bacterium]|nr:glycosyl hydrolase family 32 [Actinomycetota bacterium]
MLSIDDKWVWDFWLADSGGRHHVFYLQAPRSLRDPELRHHHATVGHAESADLRSWSTLPDALHPGPAGSWDDLAVWTGSVIRHRGRWCMAYTGISRAEGGLVQRIGVAFSDDLVTWAKHDANPVIEADARWYEQLDLGRWRDQSWRDPFLYQPDGTDHVHALITARSPHGPSDGAGVIAHARSLDLLAWEVLEPVTETGEFAQVEVPQLVRLDDSDVILFSTRSEDHSNARRARLSGTAAATGTFALVSPSGSWRFTPSDSPVAVRADEVLYAGKLARDGDGLVFLAFRENGTRGFVGELTDPLPARVTPAGLRVSTT